MRRCLCIVSYEVKCCVMSFLWDSVYSVFARTRNYLIDPPGELNPENPELAITRKRRSATGHQLS